ncbi:site-specific tyrosine recombinase XerD [Neogemmobacter tilapiae]|uniref:Tyrosine recombinase XerC n=1 Tax=Neogemmobacter tilapiae TaxID=875041 RepID=A0A918WGH6_9RHOB|nr:site-specific tyrosine recombinase XerD [Gemmobacter tilapiae]GHC44464.1 tyrosine recombinase XerD [Gemmobacter tilapiae]
MTAPQGTSRWISTFLAGQAAEAFSAQNTLLAYGRDLQAFAEWLGGDFADVDRAKIEAYLIDCEAEGLSKSTRARRLSAIRTMYRFAVEEGWRKDNPALRLKGPGVDKRLPQTVSIDEVDRLLEAARDKGRTARDQIRNRCLMEVLYASGLRVSELVSLPVAAVRGDPRAILVKGKGNKERLVPLSPPAREAIAAWLVEWDAIAELARKAGQPPSRFLFPGSGKAGHLTREYFFMLIKDFAVRAGVDPSKVTPHTIRHAFATHLLAGGADLRVIQTLMGHADVATTEIYTHVLDDHLRELVLQHHPLAKVAAK